MIYFKLGRIACTALLLISHSLFSHDEISGLWKFNHDKTDKPKLMVAVYPYQEKYYARILAIYDKNGQLQETLNAPKEKTTKLLNHPYYCGLDFIYDLKSSGKGYFGKILDASKGKEYNAEIWLDKNNLVVRGKLFLFGKNIICYRAVDADFNEQFPKPDLTKFIPSIPQIAAK